MSKVLVITNRHLCREDFLERIDSIVACDPLGIVLREKDLDESAYADLAGAVRDICESHGTPCILHSHHRVAMAIGVKAIHLPLPLLREMEDEEKSYFDIIGASIHSAQEAAEAESLGCTYLTAGHVFETDCKRGLPPRGLAFLREILRTAAIPVYAIGGITPGNARDCLAIGANGVCTMSGAMRCPIPGTYFRSFG